MKFQLLVTISVFLFSPDTAPGQISIYASPDSADIAHRIASLANDICIDLITDTAKASAIFEWITNNIAYDKFASLSRRSNHGPLDVLNNRKAICIGYAQLFRDMCASQNLDSYIISGYGITSSPDKLPAQPGHAWNAVRSGKDWLFYDATWSAGAGAAYYGGLSAREMLQTHLPAFYGWLPDDCTPDELSPIRICGLRDSLSRYLQAEPYEREIMEMRSDMHINPTRETRRNLAQALAHRAVGLKDSADLAGQADAFNYYQLADAFFESARSVSDSLFDWHVEAWGMTKCSMGSLYYNSLDEISYSVDNLLIALNYIDEGICLLELDKLSLMGQLAKQSAQDHREVILAEIDRLRKH